MNNKSFFTYIKILLLALSACIVSVDTYFYYYEQAHADEITDSKVTNLTTELVRQSPTPTPTPAATSGAETSNYRISTFNKVGTVNESSIQAAQSSFLRSTHSTDVKNVDVFELEYDILGKNNQWQPVFAKIYVPSTDGTYPLFVFGSGTTGMADKCAPSLENMAKENLGNYHSQMIAQAAEGYVTVFADYEGFHDPSDTQAYFVSKSEAVTLLGAIQSLLELQKDHPELKNADLNSVFLSGYSQGGHAALSTAQEWDQLPDTVTLKGIVEFAGASDVQALFFDSPWLASYLVESYTKYYGSNLQAFAVLQDKWLQEMTTNNETLCVNAANKHYPHDKRALYAPAFLDAIESDTWPETLANWQNTIKLNTPLSNLPNVPHLSIQGAADPIVTATTQKNNITALCEQNHQVLYKEYPGINHYDIRKAGFEFSNQWMKEVLAGSTVSSSCQI